MKINKVELVWEKIEKDSFNFGNINKVNIVFCHGEKFPVVFIDAGCLKIEDRTLKIDSEEVLKKTGEIDFENKNKYESRAQYVGNYWKFIVNDEIYEGFLGQPEYVRKFKKIIKFDLIWEYCNKKVANYLK